MLPGLDQVKGDFVVGKGKGKERRWREEREWSGNYHFQIWVQSGILVFVECGDSVRLDYIFCGYMGRALPCPSMCQVSINILQQLRRNKRRSGRNALFHLVCFCKKKRKKNFFFGGGGVVGTCNSLPLSDSAAPLQAEWSRCNWPSSMCHIFPWRDKPWPGLVPHAAASKVSCAHGCSGHRQACDGDIFPPENGNAL